jgi:transposase-like protein
MKREAAVVQRRPIIGRPESVITVPLNPAGAGSGEDAMTAKGKKRGQFATEQKLTPLEEARQPNTAVAEVLRRHQIDATTFYRWECEAKAGMLAAPQNGRRERGDHKDREIEHLKQGLGKKSRVIAEVTEENLALEKGL